MYCQRRLSANQRNTFRTKNKYREILGFRKFDKVKYFGKTYFIKGRMSSGYAILMDIYGNKVDFSNLSKGLKTAKLSNLKRISAIKSVLINQFALYPTS